ncbi:MAG: DJ-1/PfpI family protein [Actinobacteria bacterium]|nr:DJ-1/PfpI family protein [Actinomycetota bacterium]
MSSTHAHGATAANGAGQPQPKPVTIAFVLYPGFTALDIIGPFQVLAYVPGHEAVFVAAQPGPVTDDTGRCQLIASTSLHKLTAPDVVIIGGSLSTKEPDQPVVQWLRRVHPTTTWTTSVCTGSIYLAAAGILDGQEATTHWARAQQLERHGARYTQQRVVEHGKVITAAGVSSGIDMALTPGLLGAGVPAQR